MCFSRSLDHIHSGSSWKALKMGKNSYGYFYVNTSFLNELIFFLVVLIVVDVNSHLSGFLWPGVNRKNVKAECTLNGHLFLSGTLS